MRGPVGLLDALAVAMVVVAVYEVGRLSYATATGRPSERDVDAYHLAMGVSMAGMLTGHLSAFAAQAWAVGFAAAAVWFACRVPWAVAVHTNAPPSWGHRLSHVVSSLAMVYMLVAVPSGSYAMTSMADMAGGARWPALSLLLVLGLVAGIAVHLSTTVRPPGTPLLAVVDDGPSYEVGTAERGPLATRPAPAATALAAPFVAPRLASAAEVVMGVVMVAMLVSML